MVHTDFFLVKIKLGILIAQTKKIDDYKLQPLTQLLAIRMTNHPVHLFSSPQPITITSDSKTLYDQGSIYVLQYILHVGLNHRVMLQQLIISPVHYSTESSQRHCEVAKGIYKSSINTIFSEPSGPILQFFIPKL